MNLRNGLNSLLRPEDSVLVLIDHQPYQLANLNSHDPHMVVNNSTALAKAVKVFGVRTILTSVVAERGGNLFPQITDVFPEKEVCQRRSKNRPRGGAKPGQWLGAKRHGARGRHIAGAGHAALAQRANSATGDQVLVSAFRARLWPSR